MVQDTVSELKDMNLQVNRLIEYKYNGWEKITSRLTVIFQYLCPHGYSGNS